MRYFIEFSYNGSNYHGWQMQPNANSVQETLSRALQIILKSKIDLVGAGRTDAGVHAKKMFAHFDISFEIETQKTAVQLNSFLPNDIAVVRIFLVSDALHARFHAKKRSYEYHIHQTKNVFKNNISWFFQKDLDVVLMNKAAAILQDHINFESFSKVNTDVNTFNCKIFSAKWISNDDQLIFMISADRFLRNMVRAIVGTTINVGLKKISVAEFEQIILAKNRSKAGFSVPAHGLFLTDITY